MKNLIDQLSEDLKKEIKNYGLTEVFLYYGELYTTSVYEIENNLLIKIENEVTKLESQLIEPI